MVKTWQGVVGGEGQQKESSEGSYSQAASWHSLCPHAIADPRVTAVLLVHAGMGCKLTHLASKAVVGWSRH